MRIAAIGGNGFVGSALVRYLIAAGHKVTILDNHTRPVGLFHTDVVDIVGDIRSPSDVKMAISDVDAIIHLAAIVGTPACDENPAEARDINVIGTQVINEVRRKDQPLLFASTGNVYGSVTDEICTENTLLRPTTLYAENKAEAEGIIEAKGNFAILRFTTGFGVSAKMRYDSLINNWVDIVAKEGQLDVYQPNAIRSFIDVSDMARAFLFMLENFESVKNEKFNVGAEDMLLTKSQVAEIIKRNMPYDLSFTEGPVDKDMRDYYVDFSKMKKAGFETSIDIHQGVKRLIEKIKKEHGITESSKQIEIARI